MPAPCLMTSSLCSAPWQLQPDTWSCLSIPKSSASVFPAGPAAPTPEHSVSGNRPPVQPPRASATCREKPAGRGGGRTEESGVRVFLGTEQQQCREEQWLYFFAGHCLASLLPAVGSPSQGPVQPQLHLVKHQLYTKFIFARYPIIITPLHRSPSSDEAAPGGR